MMTGMESPSSGGGPPGAQACPVCTLYLREGISLQKHLDTHPKEQVIEALIRASSAGGTGVVLASLMGGSSQREQQQQSPPVPPQAHQQQGSMPQPPAPPPPQGHHIPHSSYPIAPIYEGMPINTAMMPPQFASFSYQQFVNNGTMMIPAQYAMTPTQSQPNQMMQMMYNPYGMYHQQQIPTVQMISPMAPPTPASGSTASTTILPRPPSQEQQQQSQSPVPAIEPATISEIVGSPQPSQSPSGVTITELHKEIPRVTPSPKDPEEDEEEEEEEEEEEQQQQAEIPTTEEGELHPVIDVEREHEEQQRQEQQEQQETVPHEPEPEQILPEMEPPEDEGSSCVKAPVEDEPEILEEQQEDREELMSSEPMLPLDEHSETDNAERILPDIEDNHEFESLIIRQKEHRESVITHESQVRDIISYNEQQQKQQPTEDVEKNAEAVEKDEKMDDDEEVEEEAEDLSCSRSQPQQQDPEQFNRLLLNVIENEMNNVEIEGKEKEIEKPTEGEKAPPSPEPEIVEIIPDDKEVIEKCKQSDAELSDSSESEDEMDCWDTYNYRYKFSRSAPVSPLGPSFRRCNSFSSLKSDCGISEPNLAPSVKFQPTSLRDFLKDNYDPEDMELEEPEEPQRSIKTEDCPEPPVVPPLRGVPIIKNCTAFTNVIIKKSMPVQTVFKIEGVSKKEEQEEESEDEDDDDDDGTYSEEHSQEQPTDFRIHHHQSTTVVNNFSNQLHYAQSQQQQQSSIINENHYSSINHQMTSECMDPTTSSESTSNYASQQKSVTLVQKQSSSATEVLNINENAHAGPINVFEFDGLHIVVPSTYMAESSQRAVSGISRQSLSNDDGEIKGGVNMRADETMPPRGELSEQESNGCTEQSAWQMYMGQESSRLSTSYDLMARESWEESEGSDNDVTSAGPLLDSRSLATHFTSSLFLDRDRKTPTRRIFKCNFCPEMFECPKERRVHSTLVHKDAGPSGSQDHLIHHQDFKELKILEGRANMFENIFAQGLHVQETYHHQLIHQQPLLHQLQPPAHLGLLKDGDRKLDSLNLSLMQDIICTLCNQRFTSEKSLQLHHRRMHVAEAMKRVRENARCQICNEEFNSVAAFNLHLKIHPLECGQCGKYFYRKQNFKLHMKRHLGIKPFPCTICDKAFLTKQKLDEHMNGHTGNAPVKCNLCNETFRRYSNLTQHKNRHHLNIKKKLKDYICHCGEIFHTKKKLAWHKETHDEKPKSCTYCNERFIHMASLTRHMRRAHNRRFVPDAQRENENVECPICKCIYLRSSLAVHMRVHNGERPYECQVCSKAFSTKWNLQLHKWTHAARSTKPFKCNQCSAAFYRHSDYTAHMNSHRNVRPYTCNYCGAQFIRKYNCLRHVKEHEENKQYTCDVCNKTFHRSYYLKEHLRVHSGARPYTCHICGKSSSTKSNHNKHVRIHHAREPVNTEN